MTYHGYLILLSIAAICIAVASWESIDRDITQWFKEDRITIIDIKSYISIAFSLSVVIYFLLLILPLMLVAVGRRQLREAFEYFINSIKKVANSKMQR